MTIIIWKRVVVSDLGPFKRVRAEYSLEPFGPPNDKIHKTVEVPAGSLHGRDAKGNSYITIPGRKPLSLAILCSQKEWTVGEEVRKELL